MGNVILSWIIKYWAKTFITIEGKNIRYWGQLEVSARGLIIKRYKKNWDKIVSRIFKYVVKCKHINTKIFLYKILKYVKVIQSQTQPRYTVYQKNESPLSSHSFTSGEIMNY